MTSTSLTFTAASLVLVASLLRLGATDAPASGSPAPPDATTAASGHVTHPAARAPMRAPSMAHAPAAPVPIPERAAVSDELVPAPAPAPADTRPTQDGFDVVAGSSDAVGDGRLTTFTVELEPATGADAAAVVAIVEAVLLDRDRGWAAVPGHRLQRVDDHRAADVRVVLATPATVDRLCARVGLRTNGRFSCWDGRRALLNHRRWLEGAATYGDDVAGYRTYLVSHEVGHGLGHDHRGCPASGAPAPVMMQQTKTLGGCVANPWPVP